jgi:hypothetical protein
MRNEENERTEANLLGTRNLTLTITSCSKNIMHFSERSVDVLLKECMAREENRNLTLVFPGDQV